MNPTPFPAIEILGVPFTVASVEQVVHYVLASLAQTHPGHRIGAIGVHTLVYAQQQPDVLEALRSNHINLMDPKVVVWLARWKGAKNAQKCRGPTFMRRLFMESRDHNVRHGLLGGPPGLGAALKQHIAQTLENPNVVWTYAPPFRTLTEQEIQTLAREADSRDVDILWIGLSSPKQDLLAARLARYVRRVKYLITVGAAFDMLAGRIPEAPLWMQNLGLEWLLRFWAEPRRLGPRYVRIIPLFLWYMLREILKSQHKKRNSK